LYIQIEAVYLQLKNVNFFIVKVLVNKVEEAVKFPLFDFIELEFKISQILIL